MWRNSSEHLKTALEDHWRLLNPCSACISNTVHSVFPGKATCTRQREKHWQTKRYNKRRPIPRIAGGWMLHRLFEYFRIKGGKETTGPKWTQPLPDWVVPGKIKGRGDCELNEPTQWLHHRDIKSTNFSLSFFFLSFCVATTRLSARAFSLSHSLGRADDWSGPASATARYIRSVLCWGTPPPPPSFLLEVYAPRGWNQEEEGEEEEEAVELENREWRKRRTVDTTDWNPPLKGVGITG